MESDDVTLMDHRFELYLWIILYFFAYNGNRHDDS